MASLLLCKAKWFNLPKGRKRSIIVLTGVKNVTKMLQCGNNNLIKK